MKTRIRYEVRLDGAWVPMSAHHSEQEARKKAAFLAALPRATDDVVVWEIHLAESTLQGTRIATYPCQKAEGQPYAL